MMKVAKFLLVLVIGSFGAACSEPSDCFVADNVLPLQHESLSKDSLFLFVRTSGVSDKQSFVELYDRAVEFDECGKSSIAPIASEHIDLKEGLPGNLVIEDGGITVTYMDKPFHEDWRGALTVDNRIDNN